MKTKKDRGENKKSPEQEQQQQQNKAQRKLVVLIHIYFYAGDAGCNSKCYCWKLPNGSIIFMLYIALFYMHTQIFVFIFFWGDKWLPASQLILFYHIIKYTYVLRITHHIPHMRWDLTRNGLQQKQSDDEWNNSQVSFLQKHTHTPKQYS